MDDLRSPMNNAASVKLTAMSQAAMKRSRQDRPGEDEQERVGGKADQQTGSQARPPEPLPPTERVQTQGFVSHARRTQMPGSQLNSIARRTCTHLALICSSRADGRQVIEPHSIAQANYGA